MTNITPMLAKMGVMTHCRCALDCAIVRLVETHALAREIQAQRDPRVVGVNPLVQFSICTIL